MPSRRTYIAYALAPIAIGLSFLLISRSHFQNARAVPPTPSLDRDIETLRFRLQQHPDDATPYIALAHLYAQKARETADTSYYSEIERLLGTVAKIDPRNGDVPALQASIDAGRHDFRKSLASALKAQALAPARPAYDGLVGDAELELGMYPEAIATFQAMVDKRPDFNSWSRIAYARELHGDAAGAIDALEKAIGAGSGFAENTAWAYAELGKLQARTSLEEAERSFERGLLIYPDHAPSLEGLGKAAFARGNHAAARTFFERAFAALPIAQYATDLGELAEARGDTKSADQQFAVVNITYEQSKAAGTDTDLEYALFLADHGDPALALAKARTAKANRPNIHADDALAWAHYKAGDFAPARIESSRALRLGENDPLIVFHAGMIAKANGAIPEARRLLEKALSIDPHFSIPYASAAREELKRL